MQLPDVYLLSEVQCQVRVALFVLVLPDITTWHWHCKNYESNFITNIIITIVIVIIIV